MNNVCPDSYEISLLHARVIDVYKMRRIFIDFYNIIFLVDYLTYYTLMPARPRLMNQIEMRQVVVSE
jgi:hypothetical protein